VRRGPGLGLDRGGQFGRNDGGSSGSWRNQLTQPFIIPFQLVNLALNVSEEAFLAVACHFCVQPVALAPVVEPKGAATTTKVNNENENHSVRNKPVLSHQRICHSHVWSRRFKSKPLPRSEERRCNVSFVRTARTRVGGRPDAVAVHDGPGRRPSSSSRATWRLRPWVLRRW
jgi:hypothetical protein